MDIDKDLVGELNKWIIANEINADAATLIDAMDMGTFIELNNAIDNNDNSQIMNIVNKTRATMSDVYECFATGCPSDKLMEHIIKMYPSKLTEAYYTHVRGASYMECDNLSYAMMATLLYEDLNAPGTGSGSNAGQPQQSQGLGQPQQQPITPADLQTKQQELITQLQSGDGKVAVTGGNGQATISNLVGIKQGDSPDDTLVVTSDDNSPDDVQITNLAGIDTVQEDCDDEHDELGDMENNMDDILRILQLAGVRKED